MNVRTSQNNPSLNLLLAEPVELDIDPSGPRQLGRNQQPLTTREEARILYRSSLCGEGMLDAEEKSFRKDEVKSFAGHHESARRSPRSEPVRCLICRADRGVWNVVRPRQRMFNLQRYIRVVERCCMQSASIWVGKERPSRMMFF